MGITALLLPKSWLAAEKMETHSKSNQVGSGGALVAKLCLTLNNPMDCSQPGSSVHGISQARILDWVAIPFSRGSSQPKNQTQVSRIAD